MSTEDVEISLLQSPNKDTVKPTQVQKQKKLKPNQKKQKQKRRLTRSVTQEDDDDVIIVGSTKKTPVPKATKKITKKKIPLPPRDKKDKIQSIQTLVSSWQKDLRKLLDSSVLMSEKISQLE